MGKSQCGCDNNSGKRVCKSKNSNKQKNRESNANNAQVINVDLIPGQDQQALPINVNIPTNANTSASSDGTIIPGVAAAHATPAHPQFGGLTADELQKLMHGAAELSVDALHRGNHGRLGASTEDACGCEKKKCRKAGKCKCDRPSGDRSTVGSKNKNVDMTRINNKKVNINVAVIVTRSQQNPNMANIQDAANTSSQSAASSVVDALAAAPASR